MSAIAPDIDAQANNLVRDLHRPKPQIYWLDLFLSVVVGWGAFAAAVWLPVAKAIPLAGVAVLALYRGLCFIHEISHQTSRSLPGFEWVWNLTIGFPLLLPSFIYVGVHPNHHRLSTYGTVNDPEYLPFARSIGMTLAFAGQSLLLPLALSIRFLLLTPLTFLAPGLERWTLSHFSSLSMNIRYCRDVTPETSRMIRVQSAGILGLWILLLILMPMRFFVMWYAVSAAISLINALRTLGAHAYQSDGHPLGREEQLRDSIDTPAPLWGALWAPVGLRFHALHHYFPGVPYHNLGKAHRRLRAELPGDAAIHQVTSRSLAHSLEVLCRRGLRSGN